MKAIKAMTGIQAIKEMSLHLHEEIKRLRAIEKILRSDTKKAIALYPGLEPLLKQEDRL